MAIFCARLRPGARTTSAGLAKTALGTSRARFSSMPLNLPICRLPINRDTWLINAFTTEAFLIRATEASVNRLFSIVDAAAFLSIDD
jgi:hypothetical protein